MEPAKDVREQHPDVQFDDTDRALLLALDEDPRMTTMALAQRCGLARGTVHARLERFRAA